MPAYIRLHCPFSCRGTRGRKRSIIDEIGPPHTRSPYGMQMPDRQPRNYYYYYPVVSPVSLGCYLPSDGCLSEYSVQN
jgi:hypothetical protein